METSLPIVRTFPITETYIKVAVVNVSMDIEHDTIEVVAEIEHADQPMYRGVVRVDPNDADKLSNNTFVLMQAETITWLYSDKGHVDTIW